MLLAWIGLSLIGIALIPLRVRGDTLRVLLTRMSIIMLGFSLLGFAFLFEKRNVLGMFMCFFVVWGMGIFMSVFYFIKKPQP